MILISLFQTPTGDWHLPSVLTVFGWLIGFFVTGIFLFANLYLSAAERAKAGPWQFTRQQEVAFLAKLQSGPKGKVAIEYSSADQKRAFAFAERLKGILTDSGFSVWGHMPTFLRSGSAPLVSVQIGYKNDSALAARALSEALKELGIEASLGVVSDQVAPARA